LVLGFQPGQPAQGRSASGVAGMKGTAFSMAIAGPTMSASVVGEAGPN